MTTRVNRGVRRLIALVVLAAATRAVVGAVRQVRRRQPLVQRLPLELRSRLLYVLPDWLEQPPRRHPVRAAIMERLLPAGLGRRLRVPSRGGAPGVDCFVYDPPGRTRSSAAVLWIHGGGMIIGNSRSEHGTCNRIARELGVYVISVDYRLAPEHPFPAAPEDCYTALAWLHAQADELGLDPARIAVCGASAGGGLAAVVVQMAQDRGLPVAFQGLLYPMLDDRTALVEDHDHRGELVWTAEINAAAWGWFLAHPPRSEEKRPYAAAARRKDLSGLPPAWIGVGDQDLFYPEDVAYAQRLRESGVPVELHEVAGMPHALEIDQRIPAMKAFRDSFFAALGRALSVTRGA